MMTIVTAVMLPAAAVFVCQIVDAAFSQDACRSGVMERPRFDTDAAVNMHRSR
jgi:hypothetical protein